MKFELPLTSSGADDLNTKGDEDLDQPLHMSLF